MSEQFNELRPRRSAWIEVAKVMSGLAVSSEVEEETRNVAVRNADLTFEDQLLQQYPLELETTELAEQELPLAS